MLAVLFDDLTGNSGDVRQQARVAAPSGPDAPSPSITRLLLCARSNPHRYLNPGAGYSPARHIREPSQNARDSGAVESRLRYFVSMASDQHREDGRDAAAEAVRLQRLREDARRPMSVNLAEGIALSHQLMQFTGAARSS